MMMITMAMVMIMMLTAPWGRRHPCLGESPQSPLDWISLELPPGYDDHCNYHKWWLQWSLGWRRVDHHHPHHHHLQQRRLRKTTDKEEMWDFPDIGLGENGADVLADLQQGRLKQLEVGVICCWCYGGRDDEFGVHGDDSNDGPSLMATTTHLLHKRHFHPQHPFLGPPKFPGKRWYLYSSIMILLNLIFILINVTIVIHDEDNDDDD